MTHFLHRAAAGAPVSGALVGCLALIRALGRVLGLIGPLLSGLFADLLTHTPALAAVTQSLNTANAPARALAPVLAYSISYPLGVLLPLPVAALAERP